MKLNYGRTLLIGFAFMSICAFWQLYDSIIPKILTYTFNMDAALRGVIMALDNVLALFLLPLFGVLSDRLDSKLGKRMPFIIFGTVSAVVLMMFMPVAVTEKNYLLFIILLGAVLLAMGTYRSPAVAMMPDLTPAPLRSKANAIINLMGALGGVYALAMIALLVKNDTDYFPIFACVAGLMSVTVAILVITVNERKIKDQLIKSNEQMEEEKPSEDKKGVKLPRDVMRSLIFLLLSVFFWFTSYNSVTSTYSVYAQEVWGLTGGSFASGMMVGTVAAVLSYVPIGFISSLFGRKKVILSGILMITAAFVFMLFIKEYNFIVYILLVITGIGWAAINVNSYPMVVEMGNIGDVGKYTGVYYTFSMAAQILTPILSGFLIKLLGYGVLFPYALLFSAAAFVTMMFVRHGDSKPMKKDTVTDSLNAI